MGGVPAHPRLLVVEDEELVRELMVEVLTEAGFIVDTAADSDAAMRLIDADGYSALVTDIHMPGALNGIELAQHYRAIQPNLPVMFITGRPDVLAQVGLVLSGIEMMTKPYNLGLMVATVRGMVAR